MTTSSWAPGDVVSIDFPFADGAGSKERPALVLCGPSEFGDYTVAMISSGGHADGVPLKAIDFQTGGLKHDSFVRVRQLYSATAKAFVTRRGALKPMSMKRVLATLCPVLGCR